MLDFLTKTKEINENYWALLIEPEWITSSIWNIKNGKVEVVVTSPATRWETDLIEPVDASLSSCTQTLSDDFPDPSKTVFGVPNSWIENGNIKSEYLLKLKKICDDLSLVPSGFVVLSEAISHYIKQEEETPLSGIVVGISSEVLDISMFDAGRLIGTTSVLRSVSVDEDMFEGISRLSGELESLPPRIILFNQNEKELEEVRENLISVDWSKIGLTTDTGSSKFIHTPKIEILEPHKKILAVVLAGGSEIGEVSGIVENDNSETVTEEMPIEEVNNIGEPEGVTAEDLGFSVTPSKQPINVIKAAIPVINSASLPKLPKFKKPSISFPKFNFSFGTKPLIMIGSLIFTLFVSAFAMWWILPKATVTIYVASKKLDQGITVNLGSDVKSESLEVTVSGEKTKSTSGVKTVGEKAKGSIKIQNGTAFPINLPSGTVVTSSSDLKYITLKTASISGALTPSTPGVATIDVEANAIGQEFNLKKDELFKVGNYPKAEVDGTSADAFNGGSSRQISAVSEEDKKKILKELTNELLDEAKQKLSEKITDDMLVIDSSFNTETTNEDFSNKVGDEATNIKLNLELKVKSAAVSKKELSNISKNSLSEKVPAGFVLRDDQLSYEFGLSKEENKFDVKIIANLLPSIDPVSISKQIAGKYPKIAEDYLASIPGFVNAEIRLKPRLNSKLGTLPHLSKNITIEITAQK